MPRRIIHLDMDAFYAAIEQCDSPELRGKPLIVGGDRNRGVVATGPYSIVRHPIYAGYLLTHAATLALFPSVWNVAIIVIADTALVFRALAEERVLSADSEYQSYCGRVAWHLLPGVFSLGIRDWGLGISFTIQSTLNPQSTIANPRLLVLQC